MEGLNRGGNGLQILHCKIQGSNGIRIMLYSYLFLE
jgi:hypothetical protein